MKCENCIHYNDKPHNLCAKWIMPLDRNDEPCSYFEYNDGTYSNGTWHCPRCGKPVTAWGLCNECENVYLTHESVGSALDALDSWESVSK